MADINLLPNELREKEEKKNGFFGRLAPKEELVLSNPPKEEKTTDSSVASRTSIFGNLVRPDAAMIDKNKPASRQESKPLAPPANDKPLATPIKVTDIRPANNFTKPLTDSMVSNNLKGKNEALKKSEVTPVEKKSFFARLKIFGRKKNHDSIPKKEDKRSNKELDVNLIPSDLTRDPELELPKKIFTSVALVIGSILVVAGIFLGITWYQLEVTQQIKQLETEIGSLDGQIAQYEKDKDDALALQQRLKLVRDLLESHVYWTKFFSLLEKNTLADVYYTNFSMAGKDKLVITAVTRDYQTVAKQLVAFEQAKDLVKSVRIDKAGSEVGETADTYQVNFNINLEFLPEAFAQPIK